MSSVGLGNKNRYAGETISNLAFSQSAVGVGDQHFGVEFLAAAT
jgi:hypothetical protein